MSDQERQTYEFTTCRSKILDDIFAAKSALNGTGRTLRLDTEKSTIGGPYVVTFEATPQGVKDVAQALPNRPILHQNIQDPKHGIIS